MRRALELAARGTGGDEPQPGGGLRGGEERPRGGRGVPPAGGGTPRRGHCAETSRAAARGATLYVTLEPCAHLGKRTPPCAPLVARRRACAGVWWPCRDPNPRVNGRGLRLLRRAGIRVTEGVLEEEARRLNRRFLLSCRLGRPFVLLKAGITLDGRIATATGRLALDHEPRAAPGRAPDAPPLRRRARGHRHRARGRSAAPARAADTAALSARGPGFEVADTPAKSAGPDGRTARAVVGVHARKGWGPSGTSRGRRSHRDSGDG